LAYIFQRKVESQQNPILEFCNYLQCK